MLDKKKWGRRHKREWVQSAHKLFCHACMASI